MAASASSSQDDWQELADPVSGRAYWFNSVTQQSSWERPTQPVNSSAVSSSSSSSSSPRRGSQFYAIGQLSQWQELREETSGRKYYNRSTGESSWTAPVNDSAPPADTGVRDAPAPAPAAAATATAMATAAATISDVGASAGRSVQLVRKERGLGLFLRSVYSMAGESGSAAADGSNRRRSGSRRRNSIEDPGRWVQIRDVGPDTPAHAAVQSGEMAVGDELVAVNGEVVAGTSLKDVLRRLKGAVGDTVTIEIRTS